MVDVKIISRMKEGEIPRWLIYSELTYYYNLFINGKKCYLTWKDEDHCMLYVDGFKKPGLDVDNAIHDNLTCKELFHVSMPKLDHYINEAVKQFEFKDSLNPDTAKTFEELIDEL
jgi:hypothetical protein